MDIRLFARVLSRFKYLVGAGFVVAILLAVLTVAKLPSLKPRTPLKYSSTATLLVNQPGFWLGSAVQQYTNADRAGGPVAVGDMGRLTGLANLYVQIANSDLIKARIAQMTPLRGTITATQNYSFSPSYYSTALPILTITGTSNSRQHAIAFTRVGVDALKRYITQGQSAASISDKERVVVQELLGPKKTTVVNPPKKTLPIVVFLTVMLAVTGLAFVLENLRPRPALAEVARATGEPLSARRSA